MLLPKDRIIEIAKETIETLGFVCIEIKVQLGRGAKLLKAVIHHPAKDVSMEDCSMVSNVVLRKLELEDPDFSLAFGLQIESPGVDRKVASLEEARLFIGKEIRLVVKDPSLYGVKDNVLVGLIVGAPDEALVIQNASGELKVSWVHVASAKLYFDIKKYL